MSSDLNTGFSVAVLFPMVARMALVSRCVLSPGSMPCHRVAEHGAHLRHEIAGLSKIERVVP
ncbi:MAG: hypothetical protein ISQ14_04300 [Verrucomicrobiae bacterium]|nr:hypothetical protein [Verrucomicrobiae bacterium]